MDQVWYSALACQASTEVVLVTMFLLVSSMFSIIVDVLITNMGIIVGVLITSVAFVLLLRRLRM